MKYIIFFLLLSLTAAGQQEFFHAQNKGLLLDEYPNAAAAYSLRRVNSRYTGALIRVRRDSTGQAEQDIGSIGEALDTVALKAFVRNNSGYVTTWYDQSGNTGRNAIQTTATRQPRIITAGVIQREGKMPAILFNETRTYFSHSVSVTSGQNVIMAVVKSLKDTAYVKGIFSFTPPNSRLMNGLFSSVNFISRWGTYINSFKNSGYNLFNNYSFIASFSDGLISGTVTNQFITNNNLTTVTDVGRYAGDINVRQQIGVDIIGDLYTYYNGTMQEIIVYNSEQYSNLNAFRTNINSYYAIY